MSSRDALDVHAHWYPEGCLDEVVGQDSAFRVQTDGSGGQEVLRNGSYAMSVPAGANLFESRVAAMDEAGIGLRLLSLGALDIGWAGTRAPAVARWLNDALADTCRRAPDRLRFLASLPIGTPDLVPELERAIGMGAVGVGITTTIGDLTLDAPEVRDLWREMSRRRMLVLVHPTFPNTGRPGDTGLFLRVGYLGETAMAAARLVLSGVLDESPDVRIVWSHLGGTLPMLLDRLDRGYQRLGSCQRKPSEYLRACLYDTVSSHGPALECARASFGSTTLVFGTDDPHVPNGTRLVLDALRARRWPDEEMAGILSVNARAALGSWLDSPATASR
jgi:aminocarboxymuconate-semialdehyde decarboxylase